MSTLTESSSQTEWIDALIGAKRKHALAEMAAEALRFAQEDITKRFCEMNAKGIIKVAEDVPLVVRKGEEIYVITFAFYKAEEKERVVVRRGFYIEDRCDYKIESPETAGTTLGA